MGLFRVVSATYSGEVPWCLLGDKEMEIWDCLIVVVADNVWFCSPTCLKSLSSLCVLMIRFRGAVAVLGSLCLLLLHFYHMCIHWYIGRLAGVSVLVPLPVLCPCTTFDSYASYPYKYDQLLSKTATKSNGHIFSSYSGKRFCGESVN